jgi:hypothetical protein
MVLLLAGINLLHNNNLFIRRNKVKGLSSIFFNLFSRKTIIYEIFQYCYFDVIFKGKIIFISNFVLFNFYNFFYHLSFFFFYCKFFMFRIFKAHGINMRLLKHGLLNRFFLRAGFSHGVFFSRSNSFLIKVFRKRYFIVYGFDYRIFENFSYQLRFLRRFFKYKLIGIKSQRDVFKIKIGKKKTF